MPRWRLLGQNGVLNVHRCRPHSGLAPVPRLQGTADHSHEAAKRQSDHKLDGHLQGFNLFAAGEVQAKRPDSPYDGGD